MTTTGAPTTLPTPMTPTLTRTTTNRPIGPPTGGAVVAVGAVGAAAVNRVGPTTSPTTRVRPGATARPNNGARKRASPTLPNPTTTRTPKTPTTRTAMTSTVRRRRATGAGGAAGAVSRVRVTTTTTVRHPTIRRTPSCTSGRHAPAS